MKTCYVYPHNLFDSVMESNGWNDNNIPDNKAYISICCTPDIKKNYLEKHKKEKDEHWFSESQENVLNLDFDDILTENVSTEYGIAYGINKDQAKRIVEFIELNKDKDELFIHCRSGKSRSVAVGMFVKKYLHEKHNTEIRLRAPVHGVMGMNGFVFDALCKAGSLKDSKVY